MQATRLFLLAAALAIAPAAWSADASRTAVAQAGDAAQTHAGTGTVTFVDAANARVKIAHDPIPSLNWPPMRMEFKVRDAASLKGIAKGDKVQFDLVKSGDEYVITRITRQ